MNTIAQPRLPPREDMLAAMLASDSACEGVFYTAVKTTGIFCRPTCPARKPRPENVEFFANAESCLAAGYRPCKRCRPLSLPDATPEAYARLLAEADADPRRALGEAQLQARGIDPLQLRRWCKQRYGLTFQALVRARRMAEALGRLQAGEGIDDVADALGYASVSGFRDAFGKATGVAPGQAASLKPLYYRHIDTPLGPMLAMASVDGVVLLEFLDRPILVDELRQLRLRHGFTPMPGEHPHLSQLARELEAYFADPATPFSVPLDLPGSAFQREVWAALCAIAPGQTRSYGLLAQSLGRPGAARAVGMANGQNRVAVVVPCHRVVGADGSLVGYGGGRRRKEWLLRHEGAAPGPAAAGTADLFAGAGDATAARAGEACDRDRDRAPMPGAEAECLSGAD